MKVIGAVLVALAIIFIGGAYVVKNGGGSSESSSAPVAPFPSSDDSALGNLK